MAPSLFAGFNLEDHFARGNPGAPWDLFRIGDHGADSLAPFVDIGVLPWWTPLSAGLSVFRPTTSLTVALEQALWPETPLLMHAANLALFAALVLAVGALYRRLHRGTAVWVSGLATLMFALDDAHGMPVGWLSGRHHVLGALFGVLALWAFDRWRADGWAPGAAFAPVLAGLATVSSEVGGCVAAYVLAYALTIDSAPRGRAWLAAAPTLTTVFGLRLGTTLLGYGLWGTQIANDPWRDPLAFLAGAPDRFAALTFGQWGWVPSDLWILVPPGQGRGALIAAAAVFIGLMAFAIYPVFRRSRTARFWALGAALTMFAVTDVFPQDRLLMLAGVGAFAVIAQFIAAFVDHPEWWAPGFWTRGRARFLAWSWVVIHIGVAGVLLVPRSVTAQLLGGSFERLADELPANTVGQDVVIVRAPDAWSVGATGAILRSRGQPAPRRIVALYAGSQEVSVTGAKAGVRITPRGGFFADALAAAYLGDGSPSARTAGPINLRYTDGTLDATWRAPVRLFVWDESGYHEFQPPAVGESVQLNAVRLEAAFAPDAAETGAPTR